MQARSRLYRVPTRDGWKIALHNYPHRPYHAAVDTVILCHGLGANRYNMDAPGELSLARYLHRHGWDVWVLELRGAGHASKPRLWNRLSYDWNLDDYVYHDVPAAIRFVREKTRRQQVHWVGHSMGGMLAYAFLCTHGNQWAKSIVTIASPSMKSVRNPLLDRLLPLQGLLRVINRVPQSLVARMAAPVVTRIAPKIAELVVNPDNMDPKQMRLLARRVIEDIPTGLLRQFISWYEESAMVKHYGFITYSEGLQQIQAPLYAIAGQADRLTPPEDVRAVVKRVGSTHTRFDAFGRASGCRHDYGHVDLVLGKYASSEVWPHILDWLEKHRLGQGSTRPSVTSATKA